MKIAIAAETPEPDAHIATHAARAPFYLIYTDDGTLLSAIENPYAQIERGAAPRAAQLLQQQGVDQLTAGEFGARFIEELAEYNIRAEHGTGTVAGIIQEV